MQLEVIGEDEAIRLPNKAGEMQVLKGGPVETQRGFVLHSNDFFIDNSTLPIDQKVSLTATVDILRAIASGAGPDRAVLALGYAGWQAGQLESRDATQRLAQRAGGHLADLRSPSSTRNTSAPWPGSGSTCRACRCSPATRSRARPASRWPQPSMKALSSAIELKRNTPASDCASIEPSEYIT